jgi:flagellar biogenesis protein FliO|uniref:Uncharacterized protein n=1 Tax=uncultured Chloroflexota bacterium TaxID=166587 RepID=Q2Z028_9CHLR|nr:hypothetical protein [uncultured Chloroflexota bacterium]
MAFTETEDLEEEQEELAAAGSSNRNFWIIFGVLGSILLLALICMAVYAVFILPERHDAARDQNATAIAQNTEIALFDTQTEVASRVTSTSRPTFTPLPSPTNTPLMGGGEAIPTATRVEEGVMETRVAMVTEVAATSEAAAALTQQAAPTSTELPATGFAEDVGIPGLLALAAVFIVVIFLVRRLRTAHS